MKVLGILDEGVTGRPFINVLLLGKARSGKTVLANAIFGSSTSGARLKAYIPTVAVECKRGVVKVPQEGEVGLCTWEVGYGALSRAAKDAAYQWADVLEKRKKPFDAAIIVASSEDRKGVSDAEEYLAQLAAKGVSKERTLFVLTTIGLAAPNTVKAPAISQSLGVPVLVVDLEAPKQAIAALLDIVCLGPSAAQGALTRLMES